MCPKRSQADHAMPTTRNRPGYVYQFIAGLGFLFLSTLCAAQGDLSIVKGSIVFMEYTLRLKDGSVGASNVNSSPLVYEAGGTNVLPALDRALMGLKAGDSKVVKLAPEEAYGPVKSDLLVEVALDRLPEGSRITGSVLVAGNSQGEKQRVIIRQIKDGAAIVDYNHPFAGEEVEFSVTIIDVK